MTTTSHALDALKASIDRMPDPAGRAEATALEAELATVHGVRHAIAVSSGTAALHTALVACGVGPGDEVLLPAATVIMTVSAVTAAGARPVFVDAAEDGRGMDLADVAAKTTERTRAIVPVHLAGRTDGLIDLAAYAQSAGLHVVEDACQAQGSTTRGRAAGTVGSIGCFSLKDGKIISCGEGGYLLTDDDELAARAAAYRTHWLTPAPGAPAASRRGMNYRLAEPLAALARHNLKALDQAVARRREQARQLYDLVGDAPGLTVHAPAPDDATNGYSALWRVDLDRPRDFSTRLAEAGVANSVGTYRLRAAHRHPACQDLRPADCPRAAQAVDRMLAVTLQQQTTEADLHRFAATIQREAKSWAEGR
ncbi:aminotransferase class I/II-fold pyridoxal phosphate-dependent enzyme [Streptomyces sp. NPDC000349]|uniref:DegT/DnrJ/EryC1/StrS family aminotransferase n=1 Tax=unclassified Streptomyces TaxID=2593676 RepID=UPI00278B61A7|nr:aminotransferase class I/II-fold pyridoxal phosphate-dependent enzyme [Streptomyces sp. DSM 40167]MDQ0408823.1 dTDP-4-amino-4,6-dideoxygalactose transaminase [Streptomyces sp. DSM 40167]